jgi:hydrogenase maturation protease
MLSTLVLGIGNILLTDEGVGVHVVRFLQRRYGSLPQTRLLDAGTLSYTLADEIAGAGNLIVVDAARTGGAVGSLKCFLDGDMDRYLAAARGSVHEVGLGDLLDIARLTDTLPRRRALIGIEPGSLDWGDSPTPRVAEAIEPAAQQVLALLRQWHDRNVKSGD